MLSFPRTSLFLILSISSHLAWGEPTSPNSLMEEGDSDTAIVSDEMGNEAVISIENTVDVLLEQTSNNEPVKDKAFETAESYLIVAPRCASGYVKVGNKLCLTSSLHGTARYRFAEYDCRQKHSGGRVADQADYYTVYKKLGQASFANYAITGIWLGPRTGDNLALFINDARWWDMDGETSVFGFRYYRCAYDL